MAQDNIIHIQRENDPDGFRVYMSNGIIVKGRSFFAEYNDALDSAKRVRDQRKSDDFRIRVNWIAREEEV